MSASVPDVDGVRTRIAPSLMSAGLILFPALAGANPDDRWPARPPAYGELAAPLSPEAGKGSFGLRGPAPIDATLTPDSSNSIPVDPNTPTCEVNEAGEAINPLRSDGIDPFKVANLLLGTRDSPWKALARLGIQKEDKRQIARAFRSLIRFKRHAPGYELRVATGTEGELQWMRLRIGVRKAFCATRASDGRFAIVAQTLPVEERLEKVEGLLLGRWTDALEAAGEARALGILAAALFPSYDQTTDRSSTSSGRRQRKGRGRKSRRRRSQSSLRANLAGAGLGAWVPVFRMVVEKRYVEGRLVGYGALEAIELDNGRTVKSIFRFPQQDNVHAFYDERGRPIRPTSLRAPVLDAPLTSGFGKRHHPIRNEWRMHKGVDYGAPSGTPIFAVETGTVTHADYLGQFGRLVSIAHSHGVVTRYAHLRQIASGLIAGDSVQSGDLIGYVGTTGMSTGPHLHFETIVDGIHVDPQSFRPKAPPRLRGRRRKEFLRKANKLRRKLDSGNPEDDLVS